MPQTSAMKPIGEALGATLEWSQPKAFERHYELRAGDEVIATLRWEKLFGSLAIGECADGVWTFKRAGFLSPTATARVAGTEQEAAMIRPGFRGEGTIECSGGARYRWAKLGFWGSQWDITTESGARVAHFQPKAAFLKHAAEVTIEPGEPPRELALLVLLAWYLLVLMFDDAGGATAAGAAAAAAG